MKNYKFTTYNPLNEEVHEYTTLGCHIRDARKYAKEVIANSRNNEVRHGRITLIKQ